MMTTDPSPEAAASADPGHIALAASFLCTIDIDFEPVPIFATPVGTRLLYAAKTGTVSGPGITAKVLPGSADWIVVGTDAVARIDVRAVLRTDDDQHIYLTNTGRVRLGEHSARLFAGELVTADEAYVRTAPLFDTSAERYQHLNGLLTLAFCDISLTRIHYRIYAVD